MMQRIGSVGLVAATLMLAARPASAQTITVLDCRPRIGLTIGSTSNGDRNGALGDYPEYRSGHSPDVSVSAELPLENFWSARADVGTTAWTFQDRTSLGVPLTRDRVRITRATISAVKQTPTPCGSPLRMYLGVGVGIYHYRFRHQRIADTRRGGHILAGIEIQPRDRLAFALDLGLHAIRGPGRSPVQSYLLTVGQAAAGIRFLF